MLDKANEILEDLNSDRHTAGPASFVTACAMKSNYPVQEWNRQACRNMADLDSRLCVRRGIVHARLVRIMPSRPWLMVMNQNQKSRDCRGWLKGKGRTTSRLLMQGRG